MQLNLSVIIPAVESVFTFFLIGCVGYILAGRGWFGNEFKQTTARLITLVALPFYLIYNINGSMSKSDLGQLAYGLIPPYLSIFVMLGLGAVASRAAGIPKARRGIFRTGIAFSNTMYIGLPINLALFGKESLPFVILYYFANTSLFWSVGNHLIASDGAKAPKSLFNMDTVRNIVSPPMLGFIAGLTLLALDLKLPAFLANTARLMGDITTPMVILLTGATLHGLGLSRIKFDPDLLLVLAGRFAASPLAMILSMSLVSLLFPLPALMRKVFIIQSSLPLMSSTTILVAYHGADEEFATVSVSTSLLAGVLTIPFFMLVASLAA